jgi:hypothetical protein
MKKFLLHNILNEIILEEKAYDKMLKLKQWYETEKEKIEKITNYKLWKFRTNLLSKKYSKLMHELNIENDDLYNIKGNLNNKFIYHYTDGDSLIGIIDDDNIVSGGEGISFTTNSNLYKNGFIFWHSSEYSKGRNHTNTGVKIKLDFNLLKSDGYKFKQGNEDMGTHEGEEEIRFRGEEITNITKYIVEIIILKNKESNYEELETLLHEKNIKYKIA